MPVVIPNPNVTLIPSEGTSSPTDEFPSLASITFRDRVGGLAANRQPNELRQRDLTLRDRVNKLVSNMNVLSTGVGGGLAFVPRDGSAPLAGHLDFANVYLPINLPNCTADGHAARKLYVDTVIAALQNQINAINAGSASLLRDGTLAMLGALNFGNFQGINLANPTTALHAVNKQFMEAAIAAALAGIGVAVTTINSGSGSFVIPAGAATWLGYLDAAGGGGGGGGGGINNDGAGGGGAAGQLVGLPFLFLPGDVVGYAIGIGGSNANGDSPGNRIGQTGGTTTITIDRGGDQLFEVRLTGGLGGIGGGFANNDGGEGGVCQMEGNDDDNLDVWRTVVGGPFHTGMKGINSGNDNAGGDGAHSVWGRGGTRATGSQPAGSTPEDSRGAGGGGGSDNHKAGTNGKAGTLRIRLQKAA